MTSPGRSTPNKLTPLDRALIVAAVELGRWTRADVARAFGVSGTRITQLCGPRR